MYYIYIIMHLISVCQSPMLESDLWKKLNRAIGPLWRACRVENKLDDGTPDVFFSIPTPNGRVAGMMELKCQDPTKKSTITARHYTTGQRDFARMHRGTVFFMLHSGGVYMLFGSAEAADGQSLGWHTSNSIYSSTTLDGPAIVAALTQALQGRSKQNE